MDTLHPKNRYHRSKTRNDSSVGYEWYKMARHSSPSMLSFPLLALYFKLNCSQVDSCQVVRHSPPPENAPHLHSLQLGCSDRPERTTTQQQLGHFKRAGVNPKYKVQEFRVTEDAVLPVGAELSAGHFVPGQFVDVTATS